MALLPWSNLTDDFFEPYNFLDWNNFDRNFQREFDSLIPSWSLFKHFTRHKAPRLFTELRNIDTTEKATFDKNGFHVSLDVKDFLPNEISVKTVDNALVIEAKHEEHKDDRGYSSRSSRQFKRRYAIHRGFDMDNINTQLSSDGILTINVPREDNAIEHGNVRELKIEKTGPVRMGSGTTRKM